MKPANILLGVGEPCSWISAWPRRDDVRSRARRRLSPRSTYRPNRPAANRSTVGPIFSLGCVLYEMATGVAVRTDSMLATLPGSWTTLALTSSIGAPAWFVAVVDRLLEKDPARAAVPQKSAVARAMSGPPSTAGANPLPSTLATPASGSGRRFCSALSVLTMFAARRLSLFGFVLTTSGRTSRGRGPEGLGRPSS